MNFSLFASPGRLGVQKREQLLPRPIRAIERSPQISPGAAPGTLFPLSYDAAENAAQPLRIVIFIVTGSFGRLPLADVWVIFATMSSSLHLPKMVCFPTRSGRAPSITKN